MRNSDYHGWKSVIGGFFIHLVLGTLYLLPNITQAVTAHLRKYDDSITYNDTLLVYASALAGQGLFMIAGGLIEAKIGARKCCLLGGTILVAGTLLSAAATTLNHLLLTDGIMFGMGMGICYSAPIACASRWMPEKKGLLSGIIVAGFGGGAFIFGQIALNILNPNREGIAGGGQSKESYYDSDSQIANMVPTMFLYLGLFYAVLILIGSSLLSDPPVVAETIVFESELNVIRCDQNNISQNRQLAGATYQQARSDDLEASRKLPIAVDPITVTASEDVMPTAELGRPQIGPKELLRTPLAWHLASCIITTTVGGMYLCGTYKTFGQLSFSSEMFLSTVASSASLFSAVGRIFWGALGDRMGAKQALMCMALLFSLIIMTYPVSPLLGETGFAIWTFLIFFLEGGNFALYMPLTIDTFGGKFAGANYGIIFTSYSIFSVLNITVLADSDIKYDLACKLMGCITFIGFINLCLFRIHVRSSLPLLH
jgi:MFS family permease